MNISEAIDCKEKLTSLLLKLDDILSGFTGEIADSKKYISFLQGQLDKNGLKPAMDNKNGCDWIKKDRAGDDTGVWMAKLWRIDK